MTDIRPEYPSSSEMIGTVQDRIATEDLRCAFQAFQIIIRSEELFNRIDNNCSGYGEIRHYSPYQALGQVAGKAVVEGVNRVREWRAERMYERGRKLLAELEAREDRLVLTR